MYNDVTSVLEFCSCHTKLPPIRFNRQKCQIFLKSISVGVEAWIIWKVYCWQNTEQKSCKKYDTVVKYWLFLLHWLTHLICNLVHTGQKIKKYLAQQIALKYFLLIQDTISNQWIKPTLFWNKNCQNFALQSWKI